MYRWELAEPQDNVEEEPGSKNYLKSPILGMVCFAQLHNYTLVTQIWGSDEAGGLMDKTPILKNHQSFLLIWSFRCFIWVSENTILLIELYFYFFVTAFLNTGLIMIATHTAQCTYINHINSLNMMNINLSGGWLLPEGWNFQNVLRISSYMDSLTELEGFANAHWEQARSLLTAGSFRLETQITQSTWFEDHQFLLLTSLTALH